MNRTSKPSAGRGVRLVAVLALAGLAAAGCAEREQVAQPQQGGRYQGKPDQKPWDATPTVVGSSKWAAGDKTAWEKALRTRQQSQNEYVRTP